MTCQMFPYFSEIIVTDNSNTMTVELTGQGRSVTTSFKNSIELEQFYALDGMNLIEISIPNDLEYQVLSLVLAEGEIEANALESRLCHLERGELDYLWTASGYSRDAIFDNGLHNLAIVSMERWIRDGVIVDTNSGWVLTKVGRALKTLFFGVRKKGEYGMEKSVHVS